MPLARRSRTSIAASAVGAALLAGALGAAPSAAASPVAPAAVVVAPTATSMHWSQMPVLEYGARGRAVKMLQGILGVQKTGTYGPVTLAKVKHFQKNRHLRAKGYVGPLTWRALFERPPVKKKTRTTRTTRTTLRLPVVGGRVCPAPGAAFGQGFGAPRPGHLHQGQDLFAARGSRIVAVEAGYIVREGVQGNGALRLVLQGRSGSKYFYGHMDKDLVHAGQTVRRGQVLGLMGDTGSPGAVHLHFEYWKSGGESDAVDPAPLLHSLCR
ncbi:MAG: peptidoglycan DD-metalloendopeptidase family protein [Candidatus Nanopelagicales bacterium]